MSRVGSVPITARRDPYIQLANDLMEVMKPSFILGQDKSNLEMYDDELLRMGLLTDAGPRTVRRHSPSSGLSEVRRVDNKFQINLDVPTFLIDELLVKVQDSTVVVEGKHEERTDEYGLISREFSRRYILPSDVNPDNIVSSLSKKGVLTIEAPTDTVDAPTSAMDAQALKRRKVPIDNMFPEFDVNPDNIVPSLPTNGVLTVEAATSAMDALVLKPKKVSSDSKVPESAETAEPISIVIRE